MYPKTTILSLLCFSLAKHIVRNIYHPRLSFIADFSSYAFSAYWIADTSPSVGDVIVFTNILLDEANSYNSTTGKFTAPVGGIYLFASNLCIHHNRSVRVEFVVDNVPIGRFRISDKVYSECSSGTAIGIVQKGSKVWLRVIEIESGDMFHNHPTMTFNSFTGHLLEKK